MEDFGRDIWTAGQHGYARHGCLRQIGANGVMEVLRGVGMCCRGRRADNLALEPSRFVLHTSHVVVVYM
jgi:hypothetical protein